MVLQAVVVLRGTCWPAGEDEAVEVPRGELIKLLEVDLLKAFEAVLHSGKLLKVLGGELLDLLLLEGKHCDGKPLKIPEDEPLKVLGWGIKPGEGSREANLDLIWAPGSKPGLRRIELGEGSGGVTFGLKIEPGEGLRRIKTGKGFGGPDLDFPGLYSSVDSS